MIEGTLLAAGVVASGLVAGLLVGFSVSVVPGTRRVGDPAYVETMQSINRAILNPAFLTLFLGTPLALGAASVAAFVGGADGRGWWLAAAAVTYALGCLGVTGARNVPLNDALESFDAQAATSAEMSERRHRYEAPWNRWHAVRTGGAVLAFLLAVAGALTGT